MTHPHQHGSTVIERREESGGGPATAIAVTIVGVVLAAILVWLFAFSGAIFDGDGSPQQSDQTEIQVDPGTGTDGGSTDGSTDSGDTSSGG